MAEIIVGCSLHFLKNLLKIKSLELKYWLGRCSLAFSQIFAIPREFFWLRKKMWALATILDQPHRRIFHIGILTQGTWPLNISQSQDWIYKSSQCNFIQLYAEYLGTKKGEFQSPKGQLTSKGLFDVIVSTKKTTNFFMDFCPSL